MQTNALPHYDDSVNTTGCCPRFNPEGWDRQHLSLRDLPVVRATTRSAMHVPLNMGRVFTRVNRAIEAAGGYEPGRMLVLSRDTSPWAAEHLFVVGRPVVGEEMATLSGEFETRVFEGDYREARKWHDELAELSRARGRPEGRSYFFYTTCPACAKAYGRNVVVGFAETGPAAG